MDYTVLPLWLAQLQVYEFAGQTEGLLGQELCCGNLNVVRRRGAALDAVEILGEFLVPDIAVDISFFVASYPVGKLGQLENIDEWVLVD